MSYHSTNAPSGAPLTLDPKQEFLNALYAGVDSNIDIPLVDANGKPCFIEDATHTGPLTDQGVAFLPGIDPDTDHDTYNTYRVKVSAATFDGGVTVPVWVFEKPVPVDSIQDLIEYFGVSLTQPVALPGANGPELLFADATVYTTPDQLRARYLSAEADGTNERLSEDMSGETEGTIDEEDAPVSQDKFIHADIRRTFNPEDYQRPITVSLGPKTDSKNWKPVTGPLYKFMANLCEHKEDKKDGPAFVLGDMHPGQRLKAAVKSMSAIGLDIDLGTPAHVVKAALDKLGCLAVCYTTHSHLKTETEFKRDKVRKFNADDEIDTELMRDFVRQDQHWDATIADTVEFLREEHTDKGIVAVISHDPMPKWRIVLPLTEPYVIANEGSTQKGAMEKWAKVIDAMARQLGLPYDRACIDPSRLFYFPRHDKKRTFEITLWGGPLFDWRTLSLGNALEDFANESGKGKSKSVTPDGRDLGRWAIKSASGFQIADVIEAYAPDRVRGTASGGILIECPFDEDHSDAGNRDDKACLAISAGMGNSPIFTVLCHHESCRDKTAMDFLGKMIKDQWFSKAVLEDEQFLAEVIDPTTGEVQVPTPAAAKIEKEDKARTTYEDAIDGLTPDSQPAEIEAIIALVAQASLSKLAEDKAINNVKKRTKAKKALLESALRKAKPKPDSKAPRQIQFDKNGAAIFSFEGFTPDFTEAWTFVRDELDRRNNEAGYAKYCHVEGFPAVLDNEFKGAKHFELFETRDKFWSLLNTLVAFLSNAEQSKFIKIPEEIAKHLFYQAAKLLPAAPLVSDTPCLLPNGDLITEPGYHHDLERGLNHFLRFKDGDFKVPDEPTEDDAKASVNWWRENILVDFAFCDFDAKNKETREIGFANALGMYLTAPALPLYLDVSPLHLITKSFEGEGATLLGETVGLIVEGAEPEVLDYGKDEEMNKEILARAMEGRRVMFCDDVTEFNSKVMHRKLAAQRISGRVLGETRIISIPNRFVWITTGINPEVGGETLRRSVPIRLNSKNPDPSTRKFHHPDESGMTMKQFVTARRAEAVSHLLTMIRYWVVSGQHLDAAAKMGSYEKWSMTIGGILKACGVTEFRGSRKVKTVSPEAAAQLAFVTASLAKFGMVGGSFSDFFMHHVDLGSAIFEGKREHELEGHFKRFVARINGKTFAVPGRGDVMFIREFDEATGDQVLRFAEVAAEPPVEPEPVEMSEYGEG